MIETTATTMSFNIVPPIAPDDLPIRTIHVQYKEQDESWSVALNRTWAAGKFEIVLKSSFYTPCVKYLLLFHTLRFSSIR